MAVSSLFSLAGRVAIVTGAGRGIGKAIALGLADAGADVVVGARTASDIEATAGEIIAKGRKALAVPTDVRQSDQVDNLIEKAVAQFGTIDILVNNAGGYFVASAMELSEGGWDAIIRENLKSVFLCSKAAAKVMMERKKGSIISIASVVGLRAYSSNPAYAAGKAAIINFTKTLAVDLAPYSIRVNAVAPGFIATPGSLQLLGVDTGLKAMVDRIPLGRLGQPEEVAQGVVYLASDASSYVTGETLLIDGGTASTL
jgi:NAD(P)-dependent dehydrogenase (short-subunit alcohol dehydrogenase family)